MSRLALIVEDSETCAETLQIALERIAGLEVRVVGSPRAAIATLNSATLNENGVTTATVAAIITDLHLPQSDGLAFIRQLRAEPRFALLPILLISGDSDPRLASLALETGANAFFSKPYSPAAVRRTLERLL